MQIFKPVRLMLLGAASVSAMSAAQASTISSASNGITSTTTANSQTITQTTARGIINWNDLSVAAGNTLTFNQPDKNAITLNRVIGLPNGGAITPTHIDGTIAANGQVWILNPTGVLIGSEFVQQYPTAISAAVAISGTITIGLRLITSVPVEW
jgi:filamentous hemagglutinin family protein